MTIAVDLGRKATTQTNKLQIFNNALMADRAVPSYLYCRLLSYKSETNFKILLMLGWIGLIIAPQNLNHFVRYVVYCFFVEVRQDLTMRSLAAFGTSLSLSDSRIWENTLGTISIEDAFSPVCLAVIVFPLLWKFVIAPGGWATSSLLAKWGWLTPLLSRLPPASVMSLVSNWKVETWKTIIIAPGHRKGIYCKCIRVWSSRHMYCVNLLFTLEAKRPTVMLGCSLWISLNTIGFKDHSVSPFTTALNSSSASALSMPGTLAALKYNVHHR